jgi:chaperone required for assembly of F1-ATPase
MSNDFGTPATSSKAMTITGWVLTILPCLMLVMSGVMKLQQNEEVVKGFADWPEGVAMPIAIAELGSTILYLIPQTAVLGAILLTGYLGGATATHVRLGEPIWIPVIMGVVIWLGLFLRDARVRQLAPLRKL